MGTTRYVALLRGINVGGRNIVPMAELRQAFVDGGYEDVATYIQSGNVTFAAAARPQGLEAELESMMERRFGLPLVVVVRSHRQLRDVVTKAPAGFGQRPEMFHSDVIFLKSPLTTAQAMGVVEVRDGVDQAWEGTGVLYFARVSARRTQSRLSKIVGTAEYQRMTIRSWATTTKLLGLLDAAG
jgi:uncharacterized protein (DUF1697 family)